MCVHYWVASAWTRKSQQNQWVTEISHLNTQRGQVVLWKRV